MKNPKKVVSKIGGVVLGLSMIASVCPQTAQAQYIQRSFLNPSFEQNLVPSTAKPTSPGAAVIPISTLLNCYIQVDQTSVPGWSTTHPLVNGTGNCSGFTGLALPGNANLIELWTKNFSSNSGGGVIPPDGNVLAELNAERNSQLFQNLCLFNNETIQFSVNHRGRTSATVADVASFVINSQKVVQFATANDGIPNSITTPFAPTNAIDISPNTSVSSGNGWVRHSGSLKYTGTSGNVPVGFEAISTAALPVNLTTGNFIDDTQFAGLPVIEFSADSGGAAEAESNPTSNPPKIRVVGVVPAGGIVVPISIGSGSTATLGVDFSSTNVDTTDFTMTIPVGNYDGSDATSTFFIPFKIIQDGITEVNETIVFKIGTPSNYFISSTKTCGDPPINEATYTVFDDEFLSGTVWNDLDNSAAGAFTGIQNGSEVGTNAGGSLNAILVSSGGIVLATTPVNADGTYTFKNVPFNSNVTIRLSKDAGTLNVAAPAASLPLGWVATSPLETAPFDTLTNITGKDFGIRNTANPKLLLVKRITAINDVPIATVVNDGVPSDDDNLNWVTNYLKGDITRNDVKPGDRLEYTIYFLSAGDVDITNVTICDLIPPNTTFVNNAYDTVGAGSNLGIVFANSTITPTSYLTGLFDSDRGKFYPANTVPPTACKKPTTNADLNAADNTNGLVVVDVAKRILLPLPAIVELIPFATGAGAPTNSYGFVRFQVQVK